MVKLNFIKENTIFTFKAEYPTEYLPWPVPRVGEFVRASRTAIEPFEISGVVESVEYHFLSGIGPIVTVKLK